MHHELAEDLGHIVKERLNTYMREQSVLTMASLTWIQQLAIHALR